MLSRYFIIKRLLTLFFFSQSCSIANIILLYCFIIEDFYIKKIKKYINLIYKNLYDNLFHTYTKQDRLMIKNFKLKCGMYLDLLQEIFLKQCFPDGFFSHRIFHLKHMSKKEKN